MIRKGHIPIKGVDYTCLPQHVAIIMDGNGRWAQKLDQERAYGHEMGIESVLEIIKASLKIGVSYLTLFVFSTENRLRPQVEINSIMKLILYALDRYIDDLKANETRVYCLGDLSSIDKKVADRLQKTQAATQSFDRLHLFLAINYSGRWEITQAAKKLAIECNEGRINPEKLTEKDIEKNLTQPQVPHPELLIRTGGEMRISNFLLWQLAYTELYITKVMWPDFKKKHFYNAIKAYQRRERRFGEISTATVG